MLYIVECNTIRTPVHPYNLPTTTPNKCTLNHSVPKQKNTCPYIQEGDSSLKALQQYRCIYVLIRTHTRTVHTRIHYRLNIYYIYVGKIAVSYVWFWVKKKRNKKNIYVCYVCNGGGQRLRLWCESWELRADVRWFDLKVGPIRLTTVLRHIASPHLSHHGCKLVISSDQKVTKNPYTYTSMGWVRMEWAGPV